MHLYDSFLVLLREAIEKKGIKQKWIAEQMGKSSAWVSRILSGDIEMTVRQLIDLEEVLKISPLDVIPLIQSVQTMYGQPRSLSELVDHMVREKIKKIEGQNESPQ